MLSNCGVDIECDDRQLEEFGRKYGDVVNAFFVRNFGRFLSKNTQVNASFRHITTIQVSALHLLCIPLLRSHRLGLQTFSTDPH
jgi:hypothetical protein